MQIPFDSSSLLLWSAATSMMLLTTTLLVSAYEGKATLLVDKNKLGNTAFALGMLFLATLVIYAIIF